MTRTNHKKVLGDKKRIGYPLVSDFNKIKNIITVMDDILPKPNNEPPASIRKSAFGRTNLFLNSDDAIFKEVKCSASSMARQATASIYHMHATNTLDISKHENIVCWHCCHAFEGSGFRLPRSYDASEKIYHVFGCYCSANCAKAYILEHSTFDRGYQMNVFVRMLREVYGIDTSVIEAPPRISLKMFGGPFDIDTFRTQKNVCFVVHPPFVSYCMLIEERQPIEAIGESVSSIGPTKGTVRGLRRPDPGSVSVIKDEFSSPETEGLFSEFLKQKGDTVCEQQLPPKRKKVEKIEKGLARFASS